MTSNPKMVAVEINTAGEKIPGSERTIWYSRSCGVSLLVWIEDKQAFLCEKRGDGCPDNIGKYVGISGYMNWGETSKEAASREAYEEIGLKISPSDLQLIGVNDSPENIRQNIVFRFLAILDSTSISNLTTDSLSRGGEDKEVSEITLINQNFIREHKDRFGFGHAKLMDFVASHIEEYKNYRDKIIWGYD